MSELLLQVFTYDIIFWFALGTSISSVIFDILTENRNPDIPRHNPVTNRWRRVITFFTMSKTEEEWSDINHKFYRKFIDSLFEVAKWILALAGIHALAHSTQNKFVGAFGWILAAALGGYISFVINQWFNVSMYDLPEKKIHKWIGIIIAIYLGLSISMTVHRFVKNAVDDLIKENSHSDERRRLQPINRWSEDWSWI